MKFFLAFLALFAAAIAQDYSDCTTCHMGVDALGNYLMTEAEIAAVEEGLVDLVCSTLNEDEIQTCSQGVYDWWPSVTEALFKYQGTGDVICVGACECRGTSCGVKSILKQEVSCAQCEDFMGRVSYLFGTDNFANLVYTDLSGPVFCEDPTYVFPNEVAECKGLMDLIGVKAVKALGSLLSVATPRICVDLGCTEIRSYAPHKHFIKH